MRLTGRRGEGDAEFLTVDSPGDLEALTLLLPDGVTEIRAAESGEALEVREVELEGRKQQCVVVDLHAGAPRTLRVVKDRGER